LTAVAATVSSYQDNAPATWPAGDVIDGNLGSRWSSLAVDPGWVYVDFGAPVYVDEVDILWEAACAKAYQIQVSPDAMNWTGVKSITGNAEGSGVAPTSWTGADVEKGFSGTGRYLRIYGTTRCTMYGYSIWEMRAFGDTNASCMH
jgi:hypothetical protein